MANSSEKVSRWQVAALAVMAALAVLLAGCAVPAARQGALPTPAAGGPIEGTAAAEAGSDPGGTAQPPAEQAAAETPSPTPAISGVSEELARTWDSFLRDSIAFQVERMRDKLALMQRYQNPAHFQQNRGGLIEDIDLLEDRTVFEVRRALASTTTDFDIRITYADGDTETRTCRYQVLIEQSAEDGLWYVINPAAFDPYTFCSG
ncbi:MAG: hypothetical protein Kow00124_11630 [Anaerolineae bacterium]